jgi:hypothetical protein
MRGNQNVGGARDPSTSLIYAPKYKCFGIIQSIKENLINNIALI